MKNLQNKNHEKISEYTVHIILLYLSRLQNEKRYLNSKAEEMGRMQKENEEMTEQIEQLHESHKYV